MNNNLEFENEDPSPNSIEDNHPRTNYGEGFGNQINLPNQETVEEAAERLWLDSTSQLTSKNSFIQGAKWQQERMYSEEDMIAFYNFIENHQLRKFGNVWKRITNDPKDKPLNFESVDDQYIIEWFEQFKKK